MKKIVIMLFLMCSILIYSANFSGNPIFTDIPGGTPLIKKQLFITYEFTLGSTNSPLDIIPSHNIYYNGNLRFSFTPLDYIEISLFWDSLNPLSSHINIDGYLLKEKGKYQPAIFLGIQNISMKKFASSEGDMVEYDHIPYLKLDNDGNITNNKVYNYNSIYFALSKTLGNFLLNIGFGSGRFVGFSKWSERISINGYVSLFGGIAYHLKLNDFNLWASAEEDGRDFNMAITGSYILDKYHIFISMGGQKLEHWFQNTGFQPKFYLQFGVYFK